MITPNEAKKKAAPREADLKKLEQIIDDRLVQGMIKGFDEISIDTALFRNKQTLTAITERYKGAGWAIKQGYTRDGDYYMKFDVVRSKYDTPIVKENYRKDSYNYSTYEDR